MKRSMWIASIVTLGVIDVWAAHVKHEGTLSEAGRKTFRTDTRAGKVVWVCSWSALTVWFVPHILKQPVETVLNIIES